MPSCITQGKGCIVQSGAHNACLGELFAIPCLLGGRITGERRGRLSSGPHPAVAASPDCFASAATSSTLRSLILRHARSLDSVSAFEPVSTNGRKQPCYGEVRTELRQTPHAYTDLPHKVLMMHPQMARWAGLQHLVPAGGSKRDDQGQRRHGWSLRLSLGR